MSQGREPLFAAFLALSDVLNIAFFIVFFLSGYGGVPFPAFHVPYVPPVFVNVKYFLKKV